MGCMRIMNRRHGIEVSKKGRLLTSNIMSILLMTLPQELISLDLHSIQNKGPMDVLTSHSNSHDRIEPYSSHYL
jgi:hypothetical protein